MTAPTSTRALVAQMADELHMMFGPRDDSDGVFRSIAAAARDARDDARAERDALRDELRGVRDLAKQAHEWCEDIVTNTGPQTIVRRLAKLYHTLPEETPMTTDTTMHPTDDTPAIITQIMAERDESIARLATARADALREARERVEKLSVVLTFEGEKMVYLDDVLAALDGAA